jgi:hypothetical protein
MEMSLEDYEREYALCLQKMVKYELKKDPTFLHPLLKLKYYLENKPSHEKDHEILNIYLKNKEEKVT